MGCIRRERKKRRLKENADQWEVLQGSVKRENTITAFTGGCECRKRNINKSKEGCRRGREKEEEADGVGQ